MIDPNIFKADELSLQRLAKLWNIAEADPDIYDKLFTSNPHQLVQIMPKGHGTTFNDWQSFLMDARVQQYVDRNIYAQAGYTISKLMAYDAYAKVADMTKLNTAIKYRDDHRDDYIPPVQYIYSHVPLTDDERAFTRDIIKMS